MSKATRKTFNTLFTVAGFGVGTGALVSALAWSGLGLVTRIEWLTLGCVCISNAFTTRTIGEISDLQTQMRSNLAEGMRDEQGD